MNAAVLPFVPMRELGENGAVIELLDRGYEGENKYVRLLPDTYLKRQSSRSLQPLFAEWKEHDIAIYIQFNGVERIVGAIYLIELREGSNEFSLVRRIDDSM